MYYAQDMSRKHYEEGSYKSKGTLFNIRNVFERLHVSRKAMSSYTHNKDFFLVSTVTKHCTNKSLNTQYAKPTGKDLLHAFLIV